MSGRSWIGAVVGLLAGNAIAMGVLVAASTTGATHHVVPDYYRKALAWDQEMAIERASQALGWRAGLRAEPATGGTALEITLVDRDGAPVVGAAVALSAFHRADAGSIQRIALAEVGGGRYRGQAPLRRAGVHEITVSAERGADRWRGTLVGELPGASP